MKKNLVYAMMSAIALTSAVSFTGCASDDSASVDTNPTYDGKGVRTDFAFNITKASQETRMSAANAQETGSFSFRGMTDMYLLPFDGVPGTVVTTINADKNFPLGELLNSEITNSKQKKIYSLVLPIGTDNFLFYGKANRDSQEDVKVGKLTSTLGASTKNISGENGISFSLNSIQSGLGDDAGKILAYLNAIAGTDGWAGTVTTAANDGAYQALAQLYTKFTSNAVPRAGSAEAIERTILDLFKTARAINQKSSVAQVSTIAGAICTKIDTEVGGVRVTVSASDENPDNWTAAIKGVNKTFPANLGLPMGAAQLEWTTESGFSYRTSSPSPDPWSLINPATTNTISKYRYPAELVYYANSPLRATNQYKTEANYPSTAALWDASAADGGFTSDWSDQGKVTPSTRAVAMQNNVNYGVALLESTVTLGDANLTDNQKAILGGAAEDQTTVDGTKFKVTGLLIGGQPESVDWNMINPDDDFDDIIYDKDVWYHGDPATATGTLSIGESSKNYTIVLDNYATPDGDGKQKNVLIALEIKNGEATGTNKGTDFYGKDGMIPAGGTFYLVGTLDLTSGIKTASTPASRPDSYNGRIPYEGTTDRVQRVFMQDYKTVANISINKGTALKNAYSTIPDLRSTEVVFGLSVDLTWEKGVVFDIEMK